MVHKKDLGPPHNGRDPDVRRLDVKRFDGQFVRAGEIVARQRGIHFHPGRNIGHGDGDTLFATTVGNIELGTFHGHQVVNVVLPET